MVARRPPQSSENLPLKDKNATVLLPGSDYGPGDTRSSGSAGHKNSEVAADAVKLFQKTQPVVTPSEPAVTCITAVLDSLRERQDIRDVLRLWLTDSLLCLSRLRSAVAMAPHDGSKHENKEVDWVSVNTLLNCWWPIWEAPNEEMVCPPPGTVGFLAHPTRRVQSTKWAFDVDMGSINAAIRQLLVNSSRYFDKCKLPGTVLRPASVLMSAQPLASLWPQCYFLAPKRIYSLQLSPISPPWGAPQQLGKLPC